MKKFGCLLFGFLLTIIISTCAYASPLIYEVGPDDEDGYIDYMFGEMVLPIPDYYSFELDDDETTATFEDGGKSMIKFICCRSTKSKIDELTKNIVDTHIGLLPEGSTANGVPTVEQLKVQGYDATLSTDEDRLDNLICITKNCIIYDTDHNNIVGIVMYYDKNYENTKYPNDFYKMLYSTPSISSGSSSSYDEDMDEYYKFMGDYFNALGTMADGDYAKAAEQFADMYYNLADD